jgi:hypothetical protein
MAAASSLSINGSGGLEFRVDGLFGGGISLVGEGIGFMPWPPVSDASANLGPLSVRLTCGQSIIDVQ